MVDDGPAIDERPVFWKLKAVRVDNGGVNKIASHAETGVEP